MPRHHFSSSAFPSELPARVRAKMWTDAMRASNAAFDIGVMTSRKFSGDVIVLFLGAVQVGAADTVADGEIKVVRDDASIAKAHDDRIMLVINRGPSPMTVTQFGRAVTLAVEEMALVAMDSPSTCMTPSSGCSHVIMIARDAFDRPGHVIETLAAKPLGTTTPAQRLLVHHVRDLLAMAEPLGDEAEKAAGDYIIQLTRAVLAAPGPVKATESNSRLSDIRKLIAKNCRQTDVTIDVIGKQAGLSVRSIQHVLKQHGTTFTAELTGLRLDAAFAMLRSPSPAPIADIAFKSGFADLSTFYRAFKARYGKTPRAFRDE